MKSDENGVRMMKPSAACRRTHEKKKTVTALEDCTEHEDRTPHALKEWIGYMPTR